MYWAGIGTGLEPRRVGPTDQAIEYVLESALAVSNGAIEELRKSLHGANCNASAALTKLAEREAAHAEERDRAVRENDVMRAALEASEAKVRAYRTALEWYASGQRWRPLTTTPTGDGLHSILGPSSVELDNGRTAREALATPTAPVAEHEPKCTCEAFDGPVREAWAQCPIHRDSMSPAHGQPETAREDEYVTAHVAGYGLIGIPKRYLADSIAIAGPDTVRPAPVETAREEKTK